MSDLSAVGSSAIAASDALSCWYIASICRPSGLVAGLYWKTPSAFHPVLSASLVEPEGIVMPPPAPNVIRLWAWAAVAPNAAMKPNAARPLSRPFINRLPPKDVCPASRQLARRHAAEKLRNVPPCKTLAAMRGVVSGENSLYSGLGGHPDAQRVPSIGQTVPARGRTAAASLPDPFQHPEAQRQAQQRDSPPGHGTAVGHDRQRREAESRVGKQLLPPVHRLRNLSTNSRNSLVVRASAFTRAPRLIPSAVLKPSSSYQSFLVRPSAGALEPASAVATDATSPSKVSAATARDTRPIAHASSAESSRPVAARSNAIFSPTARRSSVSTIAGTKPRCTSG